MSHMLKAISSIAMVKSTVSINDAGQEWYIRAAVRSGDLKMVVANSFKQCYTLAKTLTAGASKAFTSRVKVSYVTTAAPK